MLDTGFLRNNDFIGCLQYTNDVLFPTLEIAMDGAAKELSEFRQICNQSLSKRASQMFEAGEARLSAENIKGLQERCEELAKDIFPDTFWIRIWPKPERILRLREQLAGHKK